MGIFNSYLKEGPGVDKNAPKKRGIFLFTEVFFRKFFLLIRANIIYFLFSLPFLAISVFILAPVITSALGLESLINSTSESEIVGVMINFVIGTGVFNLFGSGPAGAAYAYVCRCFTRSQHTWVWSDGWDKFKENFKHTMFLTVLDVVVIFVLMTAIRFYSGAMIEVAGPLNGIFGVLKYVIYFVFAFYMLMHIFVYQMFVTYENTFISQIKNSLIFTLIKLPACVFLFIVTAVICIVLGFNLGLLFFPVYAIIGMSLTRFPLEFYAARVIEKNIEKVCKNEETAQNAGIGETEE